MSTLAQQISQMSPLKVALAAQQLAPKVALVNAEPIAIIGMGCRFPGDVNNPDQFWELLQQGRDAIVDMPADRWDVEAHYDPDPEAAGKMTTRHGGFLQQVDAFDAQFFGISPREAAVLDPQQRLLLEVSWEALEHAGIVPGSLHNSATGVYVGITTSEYEKLCLQSDLSTSFGNNHAVYMGTGNDTCAAAGRISYSLGLTGPCMSINTACSSSLVAAHLACESLRQRSSHLAIAGGVNLTLIPDIYTVFSKAGMLSADGRCKTFDARADGYVRGEGCGILVLKRLSDAVADGDNILAMIRGSAVNQDGRSSGLTVPNGPSQQAVIRQALNNSGVTPSQVGYVEAHGTGTSLGDPIEVGAMGAVFSEGREQPLLIGSAKTNIGHLESGAGAAGLIKTVLSLQHGEIPPNLHFNTPNPHIAWDQLPIKVVTKRTPWPMDRRIAGVSSFGYSGTNAHFVLEAAPTLAETAEAHSVDRPVHILTLSARTEDALTALVSRYDSHLLDNTETPLADICSMANSRRTLFSQRLAVVASSKEALGEQLSAFASGAQNPVMSGSSLTGEQPNIAFLFTGQGSQYTNMGRELYDTQPTFRRTLDQCDELLQAHLEYSLLDVLYPDRPSSSAPPELINETAYTQPALFAIEYSLAILWQSWGVQPDIMLGHSVGEYVAACVAGVFSVQDGLRLIAERGRLMQALPRNGTMMAIRADQARVTEAIAPYADTVSLAAINGPQSMVISGKTESIQAIGDQLVADGLDTRVLTVSHAFHSPLMAPMLAAFEAVANSISYARPRIALVSNVTGQLVKEEMSKPNYWVTHIREAVHFDSGMSVLKAQACSVFLEIGPHPILLGMGQQCIAIDEALWAASLRPNQPDTQHMLTSLGELFIRGVAVDWKGFDQDYLRHATTLPTYPFQRQRHWLPETSQTQNRSSGALRPLIDTMVQSPLLKETILETSFSTAALPFLADHQVFEEVVVPGASHLSVILSGADLMGFQVCQLEDVIFPAPLILPEAQARTIQAVLSPDPSTQNSNAVAMSFQLISTTKATPDAEPITHATGYLIDQLSGEPSTVSLPTIQKRCQQVLTPESLYDTAAEQFIEFGPSFRWISGLWRGEGEALAQFSLPESIGNLEGYWLHPGLLDACFQTAGVTLDEDASSDTLLPFTLKTMQVLSLPSEQTSWWCHVVQVGQTAWDIQLLDSSGQVLVNISGFEMRKAPRDAMMKRPMADWLYEVEWQAKPLVDKPLSDDAGRWLIFADKDGLGDHLSAQLHAQGQSCVLVKAGGEYVALMASEVSSKVQQSIINPDQASEFHRLIDEAFTQTETVCRGVIYLWSTESQPVSEAIPKIAETLSVGVLNIVQALATAAMTTQLWLVTQGALAIAAEPDLQIAQASMWGLGRTLAIEQPELSCVCLDLSPEAGADAVKTLLAELAGHDGEDQIAWRAGTRQVARLIRYKDHNQPALTQPNGPFRVQLAHYGSPDELRLTPIERREPAVNEVEIEVKATALNFRDVLNSLGMLKDYYADVLGIERAEDVPLGFECAGTIVAVGSEVSTVQVGDEVVAATEGSFASFVIVDAALVARKPENMSFEAAAGTPTAFLTAYYGLNQLAKLKPGERVLIHSAAGGVGQAAVQLAQAVGAEIFATASPGKWQVLKSQGVSQVMNSRTLDFADEILRLTDGEGVQVVLNSLNGDFIDKSFEVLAQGGRFVEIGKIGIWEPQQVAEHRPDAQYYPFDLGEVTAKDSTLMQSMLTELMDQFKNQQLTALPQTLFPINEVANAYRYMQKTKHIGKVVLTFKPENNPTIREDGSYLITGGLGGLGLKVAEHLADQGARHLILASRSGVASEAAQSLVQTLTDQGVLVSVEKADVANAEDVARLLTVAQSQLPLRGIIHAAGVIDDGALLKQTPERFSRVMAPKVQGAWHLHRQTLDIPLDHFICFSSIASLMGSPGQSNYAAANAVVDLLMHQRRAQGLPGMSINWGPWAETGMAAGLSFENEGLDKIEPARGIQVLADLMQQASYQSPAQVGVFPVKWSVFMQQFPADQVPPFVSQMQRRMPSTSAPVAGGIIDRLQAASADERAVLLEAYILSNLAKVTGQSDPLLVSATQPWEDLGLDSLMTVELKNSLDRGLGITVPIDIMMQVGTPRNLTAVVLDKVNAAISKDPEISQAADQQTQDTIDALEAEYDALARQIPQLFTMVDEQKGRQVLIDGRWRSDLASLNYLGMDLHPQVIEAVPKALQEWGVHPSWSRGIASPGLYKELEAGLADLVGAPSVLVFPSISLLHLGILPLLAGHDGVILKDVAAHRSIYEACLRAQADGTEWVECRHNDLDDLEKKLAGYALERTKIVAVDGVYSMTGDFAPLPALSELAKKYNATLYVDDAHGLGLIGENPSSETPYGHGGGGMVKHFGLSYEADRIVYIAGLSKSFSSYGAFITCNDEATKEQFEVAPPFIFSGPSPIASLASAVAGLKVNQEEGEWRRKHIYTLTRKLVIAARDMGFEVDNENYFPVIGIVVGQLEAMVEACQLLWEHDILITPAIFPSVSLNRSLMRFSITADNTEEEVDQVIRALHVIWDKVSITPPDKHDIVHLPSW